MNYQFDFSIVSIKLPLLLQGAITTLYVSVLAIAFGFVIGLTGAMIRTARVPVLRQLVIAYVEVIRNTPFLVQLFMVYFVLPLIGVRVSPLPAGVVALSLNCGGYATEVIRAGIESINESQIDAGRSLGLTSLQVFRYVIVKPAIATMFPSLSSLFITLMLGSSILSAISTPELTSVAYNITSYYYRHFEVFLFISLVYLLMSLLLSGVFKYIELRFLTTADDRERVRFLSIMKHLVPARLGRADKT